MNLSETGNLGFSGRLGKRWIRYFRWVVKAFFLVLFTVPIAYLASGQELSVSSLVFSGPTGTFSGFTTVDSFFMVPIVESPCSIWLSYYGDVNLGVWVIDPLGGLQVLVSGQVGHLLVPTVVALLIFVGVTVLLGNVFCSWACPVGTLIDGFDRVVAKSLPEIEAKRRRRRRQYVEENRRSGKEGGSCGLCPMSWIGGWLGKAIIATSLLGTAVFRFPVFCTVCPIGIVSRGLFHFKAMMTITRTWMVWWLEMLAVPVAATLLSLRERRYWCRRVCPVGALLSMVGSLNPFIKPRVRDERCVLKGCPEECRDSSLDLCMFCRVLDAKDCEQVCPVDIDLVNHGSLARCTKCMECYIACPYDAITINLTGKPDIVRATTEITKRLKHRPK